MKTHPLLSLSSEKKDFQMLEIAHTPTYDFKGIHRHDYFELILFENGGKGVQTIDFERYPISEKSLYVVMPDQVHLLEREKEENGLIIQFTNEFLQTSLQALQLNDLHMLRLNPYTCLKGEDFGRIYSLFRELKQLSESKSRYHHEQIRHLFAYTFYRVLEILPNQSDSSIESQLAYQFLGLAEKQFKELRSVEEYSKLLNVSSRKLNAELKKKIGKSALQILHDLLVVEIKRLLLVEQLSHKEISFRLNFDSQASYNRFVTKHTGLKPSELKDKISAVHK
jgi:AraC-like DNA-binding protein